MIVLSDVRTHPHGTVWARRTPSGNYRYRVSGLDWSREGYADVETALNVGDEALAELAMQEGALSS